MTEEEKSIVSALSDIKHLADRLKSFEGVLEKTNSKLSRLTEAAGELKAIQERLNAHNERIKALESARVWLITFIVSVIIAAILKTVMR